MKKLQGDRFSERLLETAARWIVLLDERALTPSEQEQLRQWLLEADSHREAFKKAASTWGRLDVLRGLSELFPIDEASDPVEPGRDIRQTDDRTQKRFANGRFAYLGAGVAAAIALVSVYWLHVSEPGSGAVTVPGEVYLTRVGETETIDLDDGSTIIANTDSRLRVEYSDTERRVRLEQGEAFFEVEHDDNRDFTVIVGDTTVRAVGTAFNVLRGATKTEVLVSEGVVEVTRRSSAPNGEPSRVAGERTLLEEGQLAEFGDSEPSVESIATDEVARRLFWRQGMLAFEGETLEQVIAEFSRYTTVEIEIGSDDLRDVRVGGYFDSSDLAGMLTALQANFGVEVTYLGPDRVLLTASN